MIKEFTVGVSHTINLGNYESMRIEASVAVSVPDDQTYDSLVDLKKHAQVELRHLLEETYRTQRRKNYDKSSSNGDTSA